MMANAAPILTRQLGSEALSLEVGENVSIPWVGRTDQEDCLIREWLDMLFFLIGAGKVTNQFRKDQRLLGFGFAKLQVKFL